MRTRINIKRLLRKHLLGYAKGVLESPRMARVAAKNDLSPYKRIYHVHLRKTAGTSLNNMVLNLSGLNPNQELYKALSETVDHRLEVNGRIFVGWNRRYINKGDYFYAFSHIPYHALRLPKDTFTFTCFRDPADRVVSHYKMLIDQRTRSVPHPSRELEDPWIGNSFNEFLDNIPSEHLQAQLYCFSKEFNPEEAAKKASELDSYVTTTNFNAGVNKLNNLLGIELKPIHIRKSPSTFSIPSVDKTRLRGMLEKEYQFLKLLSDSSTMGM